jgi:SOS response regulatory protein OraA/RecX
MPQRPAQGHRESFRERRDRRAAIDDPDVVLNAAARFLEVRPRSVDEVRRHLTQAGYRAEHVERALSRLTELGVLDDEAFARLWVESRDRARPRSENALRRELALKGIDRELAAQVLDERRGGGPGEARGDAETADGERPDPDNSAADRLLRKHARTLARVAEPRERRQRAYSLLARNGFDPAVCREATARFLASASADDEGPAVDGD